MAVTVSKRIGEAASLVNGMEWIEFIVDGATPPVFYFDFEPSLIRWYRNMGAAGTALASIEEWVRGMDRDYVLTINVAGDPAQDGLLYNNTFGFEIAQVTQALIDAGTEEQHDLGKWKVTLTGTLASNGHKQTLMVAR